MMLLGSKTLARVISLGVDMATSCYKILIALCNEDLPA